MGAALLGFGVIRRRPPTLVAMPWGWFLVGLGILILAAQLARSRMNIKIEGFRVAWGTVFLVGGLWTVLI
jgi:hypothetical protein